jgi:hypothetical protein
VPRERGQPLSGDGPCHCRTFPGRLVAPLVPGAFRTGQLFLRGHRARVARLPVGEPEGLMPNLLSSEEYTGSVKQVAASEEQPPDECDHGPEAATDGAQAEQEVEGALT